MDNCYMAEPKSVSIDINALGTQPITIGRAGENLYRSISVDCSSWLQEYPDGQIIFVLQRPDGQTYPVVVSGDNGVYTWTPSEIDTAVSGHGLLQIYMQSGEILGKSKIANIIITKGLSSGETPPDTPDWIVQVLEAAKAVEEAVEHYPYIDETTGDWFVWNVAEGQWEDTGVHAQGPDGVVTPESIEEALGFYPVSPTDLQEAVDSFTDTPLVSDLSVSVDEDSVAFTEQKVNIKTRETSSNIFNLPLANTEDAGAMSPADVLAIQQHTSQIAALEGRTVRLLYTASDSPTAAQIEQFVEDQGYTDPTTWAGIAVVVSGTYHIWHCYSSGEDPVTYTWQDDGVDTVSQFTNSVPGIIQGAASDGKVYAENDGTGSVFGWTAFKTDFQNHVNNTSNPHQVTASQVGAYTKDETDSLLSEKQDALTFDSYPVENSVNPVKSGGLWALILDIIKRIPLVFKKAFSAGNPVKIDDGVASAMDELTVSVSPKQDLNGYDRPWPAGGGKNKLKITVVTQTVDGVTFIVNDDGSILANGTALGDIVLWLTNRNDVPLANEEYKLSGCMNGSNNTYFLAIDRGGAGTVICTNGEVLFTNDDTITYSYPRLTVRSGTVFNNVLFQPMIRLATEIDATFTPYANICPITGMDEVNVQVYGDEVEDSGEFGVEVDFVNNTFTRLGDSVGKTSGNDFSPLQPWNRKRCILADDGKVLAYYGDSAYSETGFLTQAVTKDGVTYPTGTQVQVMVEQSLFFYKTVPVTMNADGVSMDKAQWWVSAYPHQGYKPHPAFVRDGVTYKHVYLSAYEGSTYDASASAYNTTDAQTVDFTASTGDKLSSIAGVKPTSGLSQTGATRAGFRRIASNRGTGWTQATVQSVTATELLFLVEYASFNMQSNIGAGITNKIDDGSANMAENTGYTSSLGNATGQADTSSSNYKAMSYRGEENVYGNIWKWVDGINIRNYGEGSVYIADHGFTDSIITDPYVDTGIDVVGSNGYVGRFGKGIEDFLFVATQIGGNSSLPVGDYFYQNKASSQYTVAILGGSWNGGAIAGGFDWDVSDAVSLRHRTIGGRLFYTPEGHADEIVNTYNHTLSPTMYGGSVDLVSGEETTEMVSVDLGTLTYSYSGSYFQVSKAALGAKAGDVYGALCSGYPVGSTAADHSVQETNNYFRFYNSAYTDPTEFASAMSGIQLVYTLATPTTKQGAVIAVATLDGTNIFSTDGDSVAGIYTQSAEGYLNDFGLN